MRSIIITGGNIHADFALDFLNKNETDLCIVADSGMNFLYKHKLIPDLIVGDFDSVNREALEYYTAQEIPMIKYRPEKDDTDTGLAVKIAMEKGAQEIYLLGATGSRLDHVLGNLQVIYGARKKGVDCFIIDAHNKIRILLPGSYKFQKKDQFGKYVSYLPFAGAVEGLDLKGFQYSLHNYHMTCDNSLGVSNEMIEEKVCVEFQKGILVMIESRD